MPRLDFMKLRPQTSHHGCKIKEKLGYKCQVCNKYCKTELCLKLHRQCHDKYKAGLYRCYLCHFTFAKKHVLKSHLHQVHFRERWKKYYDIDNAVPQCMCCQQKFSSLIDLQKHLVPTLSQFPSLSQWITKLHLQTRIKDSSHMPHANSDGTSNSAEHSNNFILNRTACDKSDLLQGKRKDLSFVTSLNENVDITQGHRKKFTSFNSNIHLEHDTMKQSRPVNSKRLNYQKNGHLQKQGKRQLLNQRDISSPTYADEGDSDSSIGDIEFFNLLKAVFKEDSFDEDSDSSEWPSYMDDHQYVQENIDNGLDGYENQSALDNMEEQLLDDVRNAPGPLKRMLHFLQTHSVADRRRGFYKCLPCQSAFSSEAQLLDHFHAHFCHICGTTFKKKASLPFHVSQHKSCRQTQQSFMKKCDLTFIQDMFEKYTAISNNGKTFTCNICHRHYSQRASLIIHMYSHSQYLDSSSGQESSTQSFPENSDSMESRKRLFPCTKCDKSFFSMNNLRGHMETHEETHRFLCSVCGKGFRRKRAMLKHLEIHSPHKTRPKFKVRLSQRNRNSPITKSSTKDIPRPVSPVYKKHLTSSSGQFVVAACFTPQKLSADEKPTIDSEGDFVCRICHKAFHAKKNLRMHMITHGPKKFVCSTCNKSFRKRSSLESHKCRL